MLAISLLLTGLQAPRRRFTLPRGSEAWPDLRTPLILSFFFFLLLLPKKHRGGRWETHPEPDLLGENIITPGVAPRVCVRVSACAGAGRTLRTDDMLL